MEKFVTDLDKLLDEFENEDISSNNTYEFSDSSGYNSLKTSTELYPTDILIERNTSQFSQMNEITELPTPTCSEYNINESVPSNFAFNDETDIQPSEISTTVDNLMPTTSEVDNCKSNISLDNAPTAVISINNEDVNLTESKLSPVLCQVPPKKKLRPNSLFGLTSITTCEDNAHEQIPSTQIPSNGNSSANSNGDISDNCSLPEPLELTLPCKKPVKRPLSLPLISPKKEEIIVPNIQIIDENSVAVMEYNSNISQESNSESSQIQRDEKDLKEQDIAYDNNAWQGIPIEDLGQKEPMWIKDDLTNNCMQCELPFTMFRRRHHCRACGRLLCSKCCCWRMQLQFSSRFFPKDRVCAVCFQYLIRIEVAKKNSQNSIISNLQPQNSVLKSSVRPQSLAVSPFSNPDNLSISDSVNNSNQSKSVIFSDGIKPGKDLLETEKSRIITPTKFQSTQKKFIKLDSSPILTSREPSLIDHMEFVSSLTDLVLQYKNRLISISNSENVAQQTKQTENQPIIIAITRNLHIHLEIIQLPYSSCSLNHTHNNLNVHCELDLIDCWYFASVGLETIGCEEVVVILKKLPNESSPPIEIFQYYFQIYQRSYKNETKFDGLEMTVELFSENNINFKEWAGIMHIRPSFQCLDKLSLPHSSFLIGILVHRWELPWAKILPLRLLLALGNQSRFYPCPIISDRNRSSVYVEVGQTILQIISPVFSFPNNLEQGFIDPSSLPTVPGMWIHLLASQETIIQIPKLSYQSILDILSYRQSETSTLALVACFSKDADSHLVCCQNEDTCKYYSSAISIQHTERTVTGATMIIFVPCNNIVEHGATIVEDVLVVRLSLMQLSCVTNSLKNLSNLILQWDSHENTESINKSFIKIVWTDNHQFSDMASIERHSLVTDESLQAAFLNVNSDDNEIIKSHRVPYSFQNVSVNPDTLKNADLKLVWTRFHYYISISSLNDTFYDDPVDVEDIIRKVAMFFSESLHLYLDLLREIDIVNIGLRVTITSETANFLVGCSKKAIYSPLSPDQSPTDDTGSNPSSYMSMKIGNCRKLHSLSISPLPDICTESLNEVLVPFLYSQSEQIRTGSVTAELEFHIID